MKMEVNKILRVVILVTYKVFLFLLLEFILCAFIYNCSNENNKNKKILDASILYFASIGSCEANNILTNQSKRNFSREAFRAFDCEDLGIYRFDSRIFSSSLEIGINPFPMDLTTDITFAGKTKTFPMPTLIFNTRNSILADPKGFSSNPRLYDFIEYRVVLLDENGKPGLETISEESMISAYSKISEQCKREFFR